MQSTTGPRLTLNLSHGKHQPEVVSVLAHIRHCPVHGSGTQGTTCTCQIEYHKALANYPDGVAVISNRGTESEAEFMKQAKALVKEWQSETAIATDTPVQHAIKEQDWQ